MLLFTPCFLLLRRRRLIAFNQVTTIASLEDFLTKESKEIAHRHDINDDEICR